MENSFFSSKMCASPLGRYFLKHKQKIRTWEFFKLIKVRFENSVSEAQKKWKLNVWIFEMDQKWQIHSLKNLVFVP